MPNFKLRLFAVALAVIIHGAAAYAQESRSAQVPTFVYGRWTIYKFIEVGGHARETKEHAQSQIGKTLNIGRHSFAHDGNVLWLEGTTCKTVKYSVKLDESGPSDPGNQGALSFYGIDAASDADDFLVVNCDKKDLCFLEFAKNQELAVYYDGWFFFLRRAAAASERTKATH